MDIIPIWIIHKTKISAQSACCNLIFVFKNYLISEEYKEPRSAVALLNSYTMPS